MTLSIRVGVLLALLPLGALAIEPGPTPKNQQQTENWLQLQVSGSVQSPIRQTASPAERELSLQRWLDSYKHEIPEYYGQKEGGKASQESALACKNGPSQAVRGARPVGAGLPAMGTVRCHLPVAPVVSRAGRTATVIAELMRSLPMGGGVWRQRQSQLGTVVHMGQAQYLRHIELDRVFGDAQVAGNLVVGLALAHQLGHVQLAWRQLFENRRDLWPGAFT